MSAPEPPSHEPRRHSRTVVVVAAAVVLVLGLTGAGLAAWAAVDHFGNDDGSGVLASPPRPSSTVPEPPYPSRLAPFYEQELDWQRCGANQCTHLRVPLDYAHPEGRTIELAVLRAPATRRGQRIGQLMVNPGGPGGSAVDYASSGAFTFGAPLTRYFDIVGMDPRGVGRSTPLDCGGTQQTDEFVGLDPDPDTPAEVATYDRVDRAYGEGCVRNSGDLVRHMTTVEAARDMDILRAALGERQVDYLGASYGTLLGATYAGLFPTHVRRMVLDGALDPKLTNLAVNLGQARGFETAFDGYVKYCIDQGGCILGSNLAEARQRIHQLLAQLDARPLPTSSGRPLTEGLARYGIIYPLYLKQLWPLLSMSLTQAIRDGNGDRLLAIADQYSGRGPKGYTDNSTAAFNAVSCLDYADSVPADQVKSHLPQFEKASPTFGRAFVYDLAKCASWPVTGTKAPAPIHARGAPPIVVIGTTRDPATPYAWARSLAAQLESGRLITRNGDGHTGFQQGSPCVDHAVERYLLGGTVPQDDLRC